MTRPSDQTHQADFTFTRFAAATILNPIADTGSISIESSSASAQLFARDNGEPRSKNAL